MPNTISKENQLNFGKLLGPWETASPQGALSFLIRKAEINNKPI